MTKKEIDITKNILEYPSYFHITQNLVQADSSIVNEFLCIVCFNISYKPLLISCCSRIFCFICAYEILKIKGKCPFCYNKEIQFELPNKLIFRILNSLKIICPLSKAFISQSNNSIIECKEDLSHNNFLDHLLNKCKITKMIKDTLRNKSDFKYNPDFVNDDLKLLVKNLTSDFFFCNKCQLIDCKSVHNCEIKKNFNITDYSQNQLLQFITVKRIDPNKKEPISTILHDHFVYFTNFRSRNSDYSSWNCDFCLDCVNRQCIDHSYNCEECDLDICSNCFAISLLKKPNLKIHLHEMKLRNDNLSWSCDVCCLNYKTRKSFQCVICDYDLCIKCYFDEC